MIPKKSRDIVNERSNGLCEICGQPATNTHHRRPRGMGGSKDPLTDEPANLIRVCGSGNVSGCHGWIESNRLDAHHWGYLVHQGHNPADVPVWIYPVGWVRLDNTGGYRLHERDTA